MVIEEDAQGCSWRRRRPSPKKPTPDRLHLVRLWYIEVGRIPQR